MNKNIELNNEQFENLLKAVGILSHMYGIMGDMVDEKYKKKSEELEKLERFLCSKTKDFGLDNVVERYGGHEVINMESEWHQDFMEDLEEYEEYCLFDNLSNKLGWRDFKNKFSQEEIEEMRKRNGGYFGVDIYDFEEKYYDEFNEHGFDRLIINQNE